MPENGSPFSFFQSDWNSDQLLKTIRELMPNVLVNDRLDLSERADGWDYKTPEQFQPFGWATVKGQRVLWEACQTFSGSWGYYRDEESWKSVEQLLIMLIDSVSKGGNILLNVGPTGRGEFDERALERLNGMGEWMKRHSRSIYGCTAAPSEFSAPQDCRLTYHAEKNRLYVHVLAYPFELLHLPGFAGKVEYAQFLHDASELKMRTYSGDEHHSTMSEAVPSEILTLHLPVKKPNATIPVIELFLK